MKGKFIHFPKCGGTSLQIVLKKNIKWLGHYKSLTPKDYDSNIIYYSNIRNPIDYYVSLWRYRVKGFRENTYDKKKKYSHIKYIRDEPNFKKWLICCLDNEDKIGDMTKNIIIYWFGNNRKLFMDQYYNEPSKRYIVKNIIKLENLNDDLLKFGIINKKGAGNIPHKNKSSKENLDYLSYYDQDLINLVYKKDKYIFEAFNYPKPIID